MKSLFYILCILLLNLTNLEESFAGGGMDSGGGLGYVCFDSKEIAKNVRDNLGFIKNSHLNHITSLQTLDLYYALLRRGVDFEKPTLINPTEEEDYNSYLERVIQIIENSIPSFGKNLREVKHKLSGHQLIWHDVGLLSVFDSDSVGRYNNELCTLTTMAIQFQEEGSNFLNIDPRLFFHEKMSTQSKAVLLLHEYMYLLARLNGRTTSRSTRIAIGYLLTSDKKTSVGEIIDQLIKLNFISPSDVTDINWRDKIYPLY